LRKAEQLAPPTSFTNSLQSSGGVIWPPVPGAPSSHLLAFPLLTQVAVLANELIADARLFP